MRSPTLFALIVLGSVSAASAQPKQEETSGRVSLKEKDAKANAPRQAGDWVQLATPTPAKHGTEFVVVGKEAGYFSKLRLDAAKGKTIVRRVKVVFDDGKTKNIQLDRVLSAAGNRSAVVDLGDSRAIDRIVVTTETETNGEYAIYGSSGGGVVGKR